jgi:hypothetical protein
MASMIFSSLQIDKNIINEDNHKDIKFLHEDTIHQIHEVSLCIGEAEGHDGEFIETISSREGRFWNIFFVNLNLMITQPWINLGEITSSRKLIKQDTNVRKRIFILDGDLIHRR